MNKILVIFLLIFNGLIAGEYQVDKSAENIVKFISDAPIEDFEGITKKIDGYIYWDDIDFLNNSELYFEVDLNSIDTGIGLRNRHMRENYLHTDKYPLTHFTGKLTKVEKNSDTEFKVTAEGKFFVHGVEKHKSIVGIITKINDNQYKINAEYTVALSDYNIDIPSIMFYKIDENMDLILEFYVINIPEEKGESE